MRGSAISALTLAAIALSNFFLRFARDISSIAARPPQPLRDHRVPRVKTFLLRVSVPLAKRVVNPPFFLPSPLINIRNLKPI